MPPAPRRGNRDIRAAGRDRGSLGSKQKARSSTCRRWLSTRQLSEERADFAVSFLSAPSERPFVVRLSSLRTAIACPENRHRRRTDRLMFVTFVLFALIAIVW